MKNQEHTHRPSFILSPESSSYMQLFWKIACGIVNITPAITHAFQCLKSICWMRMWWCCQGISGRSSSKCFFFFSSSQLPFKSTWPRQCCIIWPLQWDIRLLHREPSHANKHRQLVQQSRPGHRHLERSPSLSSQHRSDLVVLLLSFTSAQSCHCWRLTASTPARTEADAPHTHFTTHLSRHFTHSADKLHLKIIKERWSRFLGTFNCAGRWSKRDAATDRAMLTYWIVLVNESQQVARWYICSRGTSRC